MKKRPERDEARSLYSSGMTYNQIVEILHASKSTISLWCRDLARERHGAIQRDNKIRRIREKKVRKQNRVGVVAASPYGEYNLYYYLGDDQVKRVQLVHRETRQHLSLSLARYMLSCSLNRILTPDEVVAHRDNDRTNDVLSNLAIMTRSEKARHSAACRFPKLPKECIMCETVFVPKKPTVETCSKTCRYALVSMVLQDRHKNLT